MQNNLYNLKAPKPLQPYTHTHTQCNLEKKQRDMNFELLRIISMLLIVSAHILIHGKVLDNLEMFSTNYFFAETVLTFTRVSVNLYVLITGYYMITSKAKVKKIFNTWLMVLFYNIILFFVSICFGITNNITFKTIIKGIFPISSGLYWFATVYVALYFLSPFLNKLLTNLKQKQYFVLVCILSVFLVLMENLFHSNLNIDARPGTSLIWFIYLYIVAGYIRLYYNQKIHKSIYLTTSIIMLLIVTGIRIVLLKYLGKYDNRFLEFTNLFIFSSTILLFLYFREVKIKNKGISKVIGKISALTFGIYLIHENTYFRPILWLKIIRPAQYAKAPYFILYFIALTFLVFTVCGIIEYIRSKLFDLCRNFKINKRIDNKLEDINEKFWDIMED